MSTSGQHIIVEHDGIDLGDRIVMHRPDLENLPPLAFPDGYTYRQFDVRNQRDLEQVLGLYQEFYAVGFGGEWNAERLRNFVADDGLPVFFVVEHGDKIVAMATGRTHMTSGHSGYSEASQWVMKAYPHTGYISWVAVTKDHQGKKLGRELTLAILHYFAQKTAVKAAILFTHDYRLPAIRIYLKLGFKKVLLSESQIAVWENIEKALGDLNL